MIFASNTINTISHVRLTDSETPFASDALNANISLLATVFVILASNTGDASGRMSFSSFASARSARNSRNSRSRTGPLLSRNSSMERSRSRGTPSAPLFLRGEENSAATSRNDSDSYSLNTSQAILGGIDEVAEDRGEEGDDYIPTVSSVLYPTPEARMHALVDNCVEQLGMCPFHYIVIGILGLSNVVSSS